MDTEIPHINESNATTPEISPKPGSVQQMASSLQPEGQLVTKKTSVDYSPEIEGSCMRTAGKENDTPRSVQKARLGTKQPKDIRLGQSSDGKPPPEIAQRLKLTSRKIPGSRHIQSLAAPSRVVIQEYGQNSGDTTRTPLDKTERARRKPKLRLTFKAGQKLHQRLKEHLSTTRSFEQTNARITASHAHSKRGETLGPYVLAS